MTAHPSQVILLCEDDAHAQVVRSYMKKCGFNTERCLVEKIASRMVHGGGLKWVREVFAHELTACRQRHQAFSKTLLVVVADADKDKDVNQQGLEVDNRRREFGNEIAFTPADPLVLLIPRRNIETWIHFALLPDEPIDETVDYKVARKLDKADYRTAGRQIHEWAHSQTQQLPANMPPSLVSGLGDWKRIG